MATEKQIYEQIQKGKDLKTIAEHTQIISHYQNTGYLDREDAIKKYKKFKYFCCFFVKSKSRKFYFQRRRKRWQAV